MEKIEGPAIKQVKILKDIWLPEFLGAFPDLIDAAIALLERSWKSTSWKFSRCGPWLDLPIENF